MPTTSKGLRYPSSSAAPNVPQDIQNLASDLNSRISLHLGDNSFTSVTPVIAAAFPSYTDICTVTATSVGGVCTAMFSASAYNANSGADRTLDWRILCDGALVGQLSGITLALANLRPAPRAVSYSSTPAAGSHTWKLQATASAASSVYVDSGFLRITEK